jgi:hypothetical protein
MPTLLRSSELKPISVFGRLIPSRQARWFVRFWVAAVIAGSLMPGPGKEKLGLRTVRTAHAVGHIPSRHRLVHMFAFGSSWFLVSLLTRNDREALEAVGQIMAVGFLVELAQCVLYSHGRVFEWWDIRDDAIGIAVAFLAVHLARLVRRRLLPQSGSVDR